MNGGHCAAARTLAITSAACLISQEAATGSCESKITYIDGDAGVLLYRGYPIEQLAEHGDFLETCYLLLYGELPSKQQLEEFNYTITHHTMVHEQLAVLQGLIAYLAKGHI